MDKALIDKHRNRKNFLLFWMLTSIIACLYALIMYNRTMPFAEGWYTYYAQCINNYGELPYRDFVYLFPPIYIYFIAAITKIMGYKIIILRIVGVFFFVCISSGVYLCCIELVNRKRSWIASVAAICAVMYSQNENTNIFYDYIRFMDIFSIFSAYFLIRATKQMLKQQKYSLQLALSGVFIGLFILTKQNMGLIMLGYTLTLLLYLSLYFQKRPQYIFVDYAFYCLPIVLEQLVLIVFLKYSGMLPEYLKMTGSVALSAKGGWLTVLIGWLSNGRDMFMGHFHVALMLLAIVGALFTLHQAVRAWNRLIPERKNAGEWLGIVFASLVVVVFLALKYNIGLAKTIGTHVRLNVYTLFILVTSCFCFLGCWGIACIITHRRSMDNYLLLFVVSGVYFATSWGAGTSGGLAVGQATLGLALIICFLLNSLDYRYLSFLQIPVVVLVLILVAQSACNKMFNTYEWWGLTESNYWASNTESHLELLKGLKMSESTKNVYENICDPIIERTSEDDSIFCFPQIPIIYSICNRHDPGTLTKVQWFDVAADNAIIQDIEVIKHDPPAAIVLQDVPIFTYDDHENLFRDGQISATRKMREFLLNFVNTDVNGYYYYGRYQSNGNYMQLWIRDKAPQCRNDEEMPFAGGDGSFEDPYQISSPSQLRKLSQMVATGRSFEGQYVAQTADIDLCNVEFTPIGAALSETAFMGVYNGNGHTIRNLKITDHDTIYPGLFGQLGGTVVNLSLVDGKVEGEYCGGVASMAYGDNAQIINCYTQLNIEGIRAGGIADHFEGVVQNCVYEGMGNGKIACDVVSFLCNSPENLYFIGGANNNKQLGISVDMTSNSQHVSAGNKEAINALNNYAYTHDLIVAGGTLEFNVWLYDENGLPVFLK